MRRQMIRRNAVALAACMAIFPTAFGQELPKPERYSARWVVTGGAAGGASVQIDIRITKYNTDADIKNYSDILIENGPDRLRQALEKEDVGQLSPVGRVGTQLAIARKIVQGDKTIVRVLTARNFSFAELRNSGRSVDYPYTILDMVLDKDGNGTGTAIAAAKIKFNKKSKTHEIESLGHGGAFNKLLNVRLEK
jgi:hypothetical protein